MKMLFVLGNIAGHGGTERVTCELANSLAGVGDEVEILSPFGPDKPYFRLSSSIRVTGLSLPEVQGKLGRFARISRAIHKHCNDSRPDIVVLVDTILFLFCLPWAWLSHSRFVCWEHFNLSTEHGTRFRTLARSAAARWSDAIVVLTKRDAQAWRHRFNIRERVRTIPNPIPNFNANPSKLIERSRIVLAVGRLTEQKGFDILLHAWQALGEAHNGWVLRIVGSGEDEAKLKRLACDLAIADSVIFAGQTKSIEREYRDASIYVMSSRWEGLPMTLLEAQYFSLPCVSTDCPTGPSEVLSDGNGLLVQSENPLALADALAELMESPSERRNMAQAANENAKHYRRESIRCVWQKLFNDLGLI